MLWFVLVLTYSCVVVVGGGGGVCVCVVVVAVVVVVGGGGGLQNLADQLETMFHNWS